MLGAIVHSDAIIDGALLLCTLYNDSVTLFNKSTKPSGGASICNNTFAGLMSQPKIIDVGMILQTISRQRSEQCCLTLISCLLITCKSEMSLNDDDDDTETSSVEVLKALTSHLPSPLQKELQKKESSLATTIDSQNQRTLIVDTDVNDPTIKFFDNMASGQPLYNQNNSYNQLEGIELLEQLIYDEENNFANILLKCIKLCPSSFGQFNATPTISVKLISFKLYHFSIFHF